MSWCDAMHDKLAFLDGRQQVKNSNDKVLFLQTKSGKF